MDLNVLVNMLMFLLRFSFRYIETHTGKSPATKNAFMSYCIAGKVHAVYMYMYMQLILKYIFITSSAVMTVVQVF